MSSEGNREGGRGRVVEGKRRIVNWLRLTKEEEVSDIESKYSHSSTRLLESDIQRRRIESMMMMKMMKKKKQTKSTMSRKKNEENVWFRLVSSSNEIERLEGDDTSIGDRTKKNDRFFFVSYSTSTNHNGEQIIEEEEKKTKLNDYDTSWFRLAGGGEVRKKRMERVDVALTRIRANESSLIGNVKQTATEAVKRLCPWKLIRGNRVIVPNESITKPFQEKNAIPSVSVTTKTKMTELASESGSTSSSDVVVRVDRSDRLAIDSLEQPKKDEATHRKTVWEVMRARRKDCEEKEDSSFGLLGSFFGSFAAAATTPTIGTESLIPASPNEWSSRTPSMPLDHGEEGPIRMIGPETSVLVHFFERESLRSLMQSWPVSLSDVPSRPAHINLDRFEVDYTDSLVGFHEDQCPICLEIHDTNERVVVLPCACRSLYHRRCIDSWLEHRDTCPTCRTRF